MGNQEENLCLGRKLLLRKAILYDSQQTGRQDAPRMLFLLQKKERLRLRQSEIRPTAAHLPQTRERAPKHATVTIRRQVNAKLLAQI